MKNKDEVKVFLLARIYVDLEMGLTIIVTSGKD